MEWTTIVVLGLFVLACLLAIYQSRKENWTSNQNVGTVIFLIGAALGLFLDNLLTANSPILPWVEPIGAVTMVGGAVVSWYWQPD